MYPIIIYLPKTCTRLTIAANPTQTQVPNYWVLGPLGIGVHEGMKADGGGIRKAN